MDFKKKLIVSVVVIFVLAIAYILGVIFSPERVEKRKSETLLYPNLNSDAVKKIVISVDGDSLTIKRDNSDKWWVVLNNSLYPANGKRIESLLEEFKKFKSGNFVSKDPKNWDNFNVVEKKANRFTFYDSDEKKLVDLLVGKRGLGGKGFYIRRSDSNNVFLTKAFLSYYMKAEGDFWSYLKIMPEGFKQENIIKVSVHKERPFDDKDKAPKFNYVLYREVDKKGKEIWKIEGKERLKLDKDKIDRLIEDVARFEGVEFVTDKSADEVGVNSSNTYFEVFTQDDKSVRVYVGDKVKDNAQFYAKRKDGKYVYVVSAWQLKRVFKPINDIEEKEKK